MIEHRSKQTNLYLPQLVLNLIKTSRKKPHDFLAILNYTGLFPFPWHEALRVIIPVTCHHANAQILYFASLFLISNNNKHANTTYRFFTFAPCRTS